MFNDRLLLFSYNNRKSGAFNGTLIAISDMNDFLQPQRLSYDPVDQKNSPPISFTVTEQKLNDLLFNITLSAISTYQLWNTTTNVTINTASTIYRFSKPLNLFAPYGLTLVFSLPFIILGLWALNENGVSAIDGGFIQLLTTTAGSSTLRKEAVKSCLGGHKNTPKRLLNMKLRFGQLKNKSKYDIEGKRWIGRAGFGTEDEIIPLTKGAEYGGVEREGDSNLV